MRKGVTIIICLVMVISTCLIVNGEDLTGIKAPIKTITPILPTKPVIPTAPADPTTPLNPITPTLPDTTLPKASENPDIVETLKAPSELKTLTTEHNFVSLEWQDNSTTETNFIIERKTQNSEYSQLSVVSKDITKYEDTSAEPKTTYYYRVKAVKNVLDMILKKAKSTYSDYSNEIMVNTPAAPSIIIKRPDLDIKIPGEILLPQPDTTTPDTTTPETTIPDTTATDEVKAPDELEAEAKSENEILLTWQDNSDNEEGFLIFRTATGEWEGVAEIDSNAEEFKDKNLQPDTTYYYVLYAYKGESYSEASNMVEIKTIKTAEVPVTEAITELAAPKSLSAMAQSPSEILLTWQYNSDNEEGFYIYKTATGEWEEAAKLNAKVTTYTDKSVLPNTKYYYVVYAYAGNIASTESNMAEVTTPNQAAVAPAADYTGASSWALEELKKAVEYGLYTDNIMKNYSQNITREEFCELVIKLYEKLIGTGITPVSPNPFRDTMNESILKAFGAGIVKGTGADTFSPYNPITRQDICVMLYRAIAGAVPNIDTSITGVPSFTDESLIGSWAINEVKFAYKNNIMKGIGNNKIGPKDNTNREQALMLVKRVYEAFYSH